MKIPYECCIYRNLIRSVLMRKQGREIPLDENGAGVLLWGLSVFVDGAFTPEGGERLLEVLEDFRRPQFINLPDGMWSAFLEERLPGELQEKTNRIYRLDPVNGAEDGEVCPDIVPVTREFLQKDLPGTDMLRDELYSYTDEEDFLRNGLGFALVRDGAVRGYCLGEYSADDGHGINIWVDEAYRRMGYAGAMTRAFLARCAAMGHTAYWVCDTDNIPSNRTAAGCGLIPEAEARYWMRG